MITVHFLAAVCWSWAIFAIGFVVGWASAKSE